MGRTGGISTGLLIALLALSPLDGGFSPAHAQQKMANVAAPRGEDSISYVVRRGDTLYGLASRYMTRLSDWRIVRQRNRIADIHTITPGTVLSVPVRLLKSEALTARVIAFKGNCRMEAGDGRDQPLALGMTILPGTAIETGAGGFATLELSNGSRISLPSRTRIRVTTMRKFLLNGSVDFDFLVEKGRIETSATPLGAQGGRYRIRTPIAVSAVRGTTFRVGYEDLDSPSLTEVIEGTVGVGAQGGGAATAIEEGFGAGVSASGEVVKEVLLRAPELQDPGKVHVDPVVRFQIVPVEGARGYHVQIAADAGFVELAAEATSDTPIVDFADITNGRWFVRVTAIAESGLEGMPQTYAMRRVLTGLAASAEAADDGYRFRWSGSGEGRRVYHFRLRSDQPGAAPLIDEPGLISDMLTVSDLPPGKYLWRVGVRQYADGEETANWLPEQSLIVADAAGGAAASTGIGAADRK